MMRDTLIPNVGVLLSREDSLIRLIQAKNIGTLRLRKNTLRGFLLRSG